MCIVDDEPGMRKALGRLLGAEGFSVCAYSSAEAFLAEFRPEAILCLILDIAMPEMDGMELQRRLAGTGAAIVFLSAHGDIPMSVRAMKDGAVDFLTKPVNDADLLRAVREALAVARLRHEESQRRAQCAARYERLTPREREVMKHVLAGKLNKQIAAELGTGEQNIKIHRGRVMEKLGVQSVADLVRTAERIGVR